MYLHLVCVGLSALAWALPPAFGRLDRILNKTALTDYTAIERIEEDILHDMNMPYMAQGKAATRWSWWPLLAASLALVAAAAEIYNAPDGTLSLSSSSSVASLSVLSFWVSLSRHAVRNLKVQLQLYCMLLALVQVCRPSSYSYCRAPLFVLSACSIVLELALPILAPWRCFRSVSICISLSLFIIEGVLDGRLLASNETDIVQSASSSISSATLVDVDDAKRPRDLDSAGCLLSSCFAGNVESFVRQGVHRPVTSATIPSLPGDMAASLVLSDLRRARRAFPKRSLLFHLYWANRKDAALKCLTVLFKCCFALCLPPLTRVLLFHLSVPRASQDTGRAYLTAVGIGFVLLATETMGLQAFRRGRRLVVKVQSALMCSVLAKGAMLRATMDDKEGKELAVTSASIQNVGLRDMLGGTLTLAVGFDR
jgi:hypothetical protein